MPPRLFYNPRIWLIAALLAALAGIHHADFGSLVDVPLSKRKQSGEVSYASIDRLVEQVVQHYAFDTYRNTVSDSIFAVNAVKPPDPVEVIEAKPEPPPPPPPEPKLNPFAANLEVTGIAITPEHKLVMVWDKVEKETHLLREHETLYRWKVVSIDSQQVVLRHALGGRYVFIVNEDTAVEETN